MRIPLGMLFTLAGYFVWATSFAGSTGAAISGLGH
jgi:hypothetical protein